MLTPLVTLVDGGPVNLRVDDWFYKDAVKIRMSLGNMLNISNHDLLAHSGKTVHYVDQCNIFIWVQPCEAMCHCCII